MRHSIRDMSYEPFSQEPEYLELNRAFMQALVPHLPRCRHVLDLAFGTGVLTQALLMELTRAGIGLPVSVLGIDISRESLRLAQEKFRTSQWSTVVGMVECPGETPPVGQGTVDLVLIGNAIHCFADKGSLLREIRRALTPGAILAFNSSFYAGTIVRGTERIYTQWMTAAVEYIRRKDEALRRAGMPGITRVRGYGRPAFSNRWQSPREYAALLEDNAFQVRSIEERVYDMTRKNLESVGAYAGLASVLLSGYPTEIACEALEQSVAPVFAKEGVESVARLSLEIIATRRP